MDIAPLPFAELDSALAGGALVLTPNHRTARRLQEDWGRRRAAAGAGPVCPSPAIHAVDIWVRRAWETLRDTGRTAPAHLLEPVQELLLWKQIIECSSAGHAFLNLDAAARKVREAHALLRQWEISAAELQAFARAQVEPLADTEVFLEWLDAYERRCRTHKLLSLSQLIPLCVDALADGRMPAPRLLVLSGFRHPPPLYRRLFEALGAGAAGVHALEEETAGRAPLRKVAARDAVHELEAAARWAGEVLGADPRVRIGIVCPDLAQRGRSAARIFSGILTPAAAWRGDPGRIFSVSAAAPLDAAPLVDAALAILALNVPAADVLEFCRLLRSPFLAGADDEADARAELEYCLRRQGETRAALADVRARAAQQDKPWHCPVLARGLMTLETLQRQARGRRPPGDWIDLLERQLEALGWPGDRTPDAGEHAVLAGWHETLAALHSAALLCGEVEYRDALPLLRSLLRGANQPTVDGDAPVRILTPVEAEGLRFTHLWVMGLTETQWPPAARPNLFLPLAVQRRHGVPEADIGLHATRADELLRALLKSTAREVVLSHPQRGEEGEFAPAAVFTELSGTPEPAAAVSTAPGLHPWLKLLLGAAELETLADEARLPFTSAGDYTGGGIALLESQSNCPFRGFAIHRLDARELPAVAIGLSPAARGELLHGALQAFWNGVKDQRALLALDQAALGRQLDEAIDAALRECARRRPQTLGPRLRELEAQRLRRLLTLWMQKERERGWFQVSHAERDVHWRHAELELRFRIDRIETYEDGTLGLVDYKSGRLATLRWDDERPEHPQLPLYLLAVEDELRLGKVNALLLARVNIEECCFRGITARPGICEGQEVERQRNLPEGSTWETLRERWRAALQALADEFIAGEHAVCPRSRATCTYCHLDALCRIADPCEAEEPE